MLTEKEIKDAADESIKDFRKYKGISTTWHEAFTEGATWANTENTKTVKSLIEASEEYVKMCEKEIQSRESGGSSVVFYMQPSAITAREKIKQLTDKL